MDIALVDLKMPGLNGCQTLDALKNEHPWMEIVILTGHGAIDSAVACTRIGAYAYLQKPCAVEKLMEVLIQAYQKRVAARNQVNARKLNKILSITIGDPPQKILEKLADFDRNGQDKGL
jgi:DNA-binding NtrC family response regulator